MPSPVGRSWHWAYYIKFGFDQQFCVKTSREQMGIKLQALMENMWQHIPKNGDDDDDDDDDLWSSLANRYKIMTASREKGRHHSEI